MHILVGTLPLPLSLSLLHAHTHARTHTYTHTHARARSELALPSASHGEHGFSWQQLCPPAASGLEPNCTEEPGGSTGSLCLPPHPSRSHPRGRYPREAQCLEHIPSLLRQKQKASTKTLSHQPAVIERRFQQTAVILYKINPKVPGTVAQIT